MALFAVGVLAGWRSLAAFVLLGRSADRTRVRRLRPG